MFELLERPLLEVDPAGLVEQEDVHASVKQSLPVNLPSFHGTHHKIVGIHYIQDLEILVGHELGNKNEEVEVVQDDHEIDEEYDTEEVFDDGEVLVKAEYCQA